MIRRQHLLVALFAICLALGLTACGESKEDKALASVCNSRDDIQKQVDTLEGLTITTATADQVQTSVTAIYNDLKNIGTQVDTLADSVKPQVQQANQQFTASLTKIAASVGRSLSLDDATDQAQTALTQLATSYQQTFAELDCPS